MKRYGLVVVVAGVAIALALMLQGRSPNDTVELPQGAHDGHDHGEMGEATHPPVATSQASAEGMDFSGIEVPSGGARIAELYARKKELAGKEVIVRGKVTKFTPNVMGKNWIHMMDGTGSEGTNDLTVTTATAVQVGDVVLVRGVMNVDRDFGMGYAYEILVEDAEVTVE